MHAVHNGYLHLIQLTISFWILKMTTKSVMVKILLTDNLCCGEKMPRKRNARGSVQEITTVGHFLGYGMVFALVVILRFLPYTIMQLLLKKKVKRIYHSLSIVL